MTWCSLEPGGFPPPPPLKKKTPRGFQHNFDTFQPFLGGAKESGYGGIKKVPCLEGIAMKGHPGLVFKPAKRFDTASHKDSHVDLYVPMIQWLGSTVMVTLIDPILFVWVKIDLLVTIYLRLPSDSSANTSCSQP